MKILHIVWSGHSGGAERLLQNIVAYSDRTRLTHEVCFLYEGGRVAEQIKNSGIKVCLVRIRNNFSIMGGIRFLRMLNSSSPGVIQNNTTNCLANILILLFSKAYKIYFEHGDLIGDEYRREIKFYHYFGRFYDLILTNSNFTKNKIMELTKIQPGRIQIFYPGVDPMVFKSDRPNNELKKQLDIPADNKILGIVGRLVDAKGIDDFIQVAAEIKKLKSDGKYSFIVVGEGPSKTILEEKALLSGVDIKFLGDRQDIPELLSIFDLFVFTSKWESFGIALLEALAAKVPIVGFKVGGAEEILKAGGGGLLLDGRDCKELAEKAVMLLADDKEHDKLSKEGRANVEKNFNIKNNIKKLEEAYEAEVSLK